MVTLVEMTEFRSKNCRLELVQTRIGSHIVTHIPFAPPILAQSAEARLDHNILAYHRSGITDRSKISEASKKKYDLLIGKYL